MASQVPIFHLPGSPAEAGLAHGRMLRDDLFAPGFVEAYLARLAITNRFQRDEVDEQAARWLLTLPTHFQEEIAGMAEGAGVSQQTVTTFLYADIARPTPANSDQSPPAAVDQTRRTRESADASPAPAIDLQTLAITEGAEPSRIAEPIDEVMPADLPEEPCCADRDGSLNGPAGDAATDADADADADTNANAADADADADGPMCSAIIATLRDRSMWVARNCDWLTPTLMRGTAAVIHETPHRIPVLAVGIRGDIDVDTGINAERLWLHLHTLPAMDTPPASRSMISWLFWSREALECCATLDELERFIAATARDRGVLAIAGDGKTNEAAIFECSRAGHVRHDVDPLNPCVATNHPPGKQIEPDREAKARPGGTIGRHCGMRRCLQRRQPERGPADLMRILADPQVEMRTPTHMRTIYSAVVRPRDQRIWFAAGRPDGTPAASGGRWTEIEVPWTR
ncbi:MAG: hypothetical protein ACOC0P_03245 [Planctomycetota bacterium]